VNDMVAWSVTMPIESQNTKKSLLELVIGKSIAERVDWTVEIAQPI